MEPSRPKAISDTPWEDRDPLDPRPDDRKAGWDEEDTRIFLDCGVYFVPDREVQIEILCDLITPVDPPFHILDLGCGEGVLAGALLERFPGCVVHGVDVSPEMLNRAGANLVRFGDRFSAEQSDLALRAWWHPDAQIHYAVSSLAIHHLDSSQKQSLFRDIRNLLVPDGAFLIADVIQPVFGPGVAVAAKAWDEAVRRRSLEIDGNTRAFEIFQREKWNAYRFSDPIDKMSGLFEQLRWMEQAGFVDIDIFWMKAGQAIFGGRNPGL